MFQNLPMVLNMFFTGIGEFSGLYDKIVYVSTSRHGGILRPMGQPGGSDEFKF